MIVKIIGFCCSFDRFEGNIGQIKNSEIGYEKIS